MQVQDNTVGPEVKVNTMVQGAVFKTRKDNMGNTYIKLSTTTLANGGAISKLLEGPPGSSLVSNINGFVYVFEADTTGIEFDATLTLNGVKLKV